MIAEIVERMPAIPSQGGRTLDRLTGQVDLVKLNFKYPTRDTVVLNDLSLSVRPGQTVAFVRLLRRGCRGLISFAAQVGESGSGKSTIFALIERFYDPQRGQVLIDGVDLKELDPKWYHRHVGIVSQEPILFSGTIKENIMYGKEDATEEEVIAAAKAGKSAGLHPCGLFVTGAGFRFNSKRTRLRDGPPQWL